VARRRHELGLTRADLAERAGMAPEFVDYVETQPAELGDASLHRLAAALETTRPELLGSGHDRPPGRPGAAMRPRLRELTPQECWDLIATGGVGRVATTTDDGPIVLPVNFIVDQETVVIRTSAYGVLGRIGPAAELAFEVDRLDEAMREGWSVLLVGRMERIESPDEVAALLKSRRHEPWPGGARNLVLRIRPRRVTGRRIEAS
jgi:nitroimidazol reductase NimA-like FMN-containing flavoprotein (pyridoxamine 5'-phosphate oxidase superfamily)